MKEQPSTPRSALEAAIKVCADKSMAYHQAGDIPRANAAYECKLALFELMASTPVSESTSISASGAYELKLYGTPGYVGTIAGITVHADPEVPEHTVILKDEHGRELGRIINVGRY
jgi:hypothetical protein